MVDESRDRIIDAEVEAITPSPSKSWWRRLGDLTQPQSRGPLLRVSAITLVLGLVLGLALPYVPGLIATRYFATKDTTSVIPGADTPAPYSDAAPAPAPDASGGEPALTVWPADSGKTADDRLQEMAKRLQSLETRLARPAPDPALAGRLDALEQNLAKLNEGPQRLILGRRSAIVQAVARLRAAIATGRPYAVEMAQVESAQADGRVEFDAPVLAVLRAAATDGMPTLARLQREFPAAVRDAIRAERLVPAATWWQSAANRLAASVTVRRIGEVGGEATDAVLARAEKRLGAGDVAAALAELDSLSGAPAVAAILAWRQAATRHAGVMQAMARLDEMALAGLNVTESGTGPGTGSGQ